MPHTLRAQKKPRSEASNGAQGRKQQRKAGTERFSFAKGKTRCGGPAPPGPKRAEKSHFPQNDGPYDLKRTTFQTENALERAVADHSPASAPKTAGNKHTHRPPPANTVHDARASAAAVIIVRTTKHLFSCRGRQAKSQELVQKITHHAPDGNTIFTTRHQHIEIQIRILFTTACRHGCFFPHSALVNTTCRNDDRAFQL